MTGSRIRRTTLPPFRDPLFFGDALTTITTKEYIIKQQVDAARIKAMDFGKSHPPGNNKTAEGQAWNRRVAFKVSQ